MKRYIIILHGCDDRTDVEMELSESEAEVVNRVAVAINAESTYRCKPTMSIEELPFSEW